MVYEMLAVYHSLLFNMQSIGELMNKLLSLALSVSLLSACSSQFVGNTSLRDTHNSIIDQKIIPNETTKQQVREMFGEPTKTETRPYDLSEIWTYDAYDEHTNYVPTALFPITLPLSIVFGHNLMRPTVKKENQKQLRIQFENNKATKFSTAVDNKNWY
ncbi:hypothetical protein F480_07295 [Bibersteinia trehalosi Y31]|uniref:Lipoprotein SmpA/OmlA domain-containing protein n=2 Tax=Bibersteinia trehalosi TaxID=47735 RepID=A0A179CXF7_BIBTR|nr:hypothetical protein F480_07295 [Bibersteinia trehalosi Y31]TCT15934.1 hypothetical protein EDC51_105200 [Bibersteinia trehalosi]